VCLKWVILLQSYLFPALLFLMVQDTLKFFTVFLLVLIGAAQGGGRVSTFVEIELLN